MIISLADIKQHSQFIGELSEKGKAIIAELKNYIASQFPDDFKIHSTLNDLNVSYYGLRLIFRVEISGGYTDTKATIAAYYLTYEEQPKEIGCGLVYEFDNNGNIFRTDPEDRRHNAVRTQFSAEFITFLFNVLFASGNVVTLRP